MAQITAAIALELANSVNDVLRQAGSVITGQQDLWIRDGVPESIYGRLQQATARQSCRRYADDPSKFQGKGSTLVEKACRPYLDSIGYGTAPTILSPVIGGQCPGVSYNVTIFRTSTSTGQPSNLVRNGDVGPIELLTGANTVTTCNAPKVRVPAYTYRAGGVNRLAFGNTCSDFQSNPSVVAVRSDGQPDTCGSVPPDIQPPTGVPGPRPRFEPFSPSPDIRVDIGVEILPDATINVNFGTGDINIDPFADEPGGGTDPGVPGSGGPAPGDIGDPAAPLDTGDGGDAGGEAPEGSVIGALKVNILESPSRAREFRPGVFRAVCYAYLGTVDGLDLDPAGATLRDGQLILPEKENLTRWRVDANTGFSLRVTPYYREVEA